MSVNKAILGSLERAMADLGLQFARESKNAEELKDKYNVAVARGAAIRAQIAQLEGTIRSLKGEPSLSMDGDSKAVAALTEILGKGPHTLQELQTAIELRGLSRHSVRKALGGIAFARVGKGTTMKYVLRDSLYEPQV